MTVFEKRYGISREELRRKISHQKMLGHAKASRMFARAVKGQGPEFKKISDRHEKQAKEKK